MTEHATDPFEDDLRRTLRHEAVVDEHIEQPSFGSIATRGRRRQHRRRDLAVAGVGAVGLLGSAAAVRLTATATATDDAEVATVPTTTTGTVVDPPVVDTTVVDTTTVDTTTVDTTTVDPASLIGNPIVLWATEPVPPGCAAFAAAHPTARGVRRPPQPVAMPPMVGQRDDPSEGTGPRFDREQDVPAIQRRIVTGAEARVLYELDPDFDGWLMIGPEVVGDFVYFGVESRAAREGEPFWPESDAVIRRVPVDGGPAEDLPGSPHGRDFRVSPDGRHVAVADVEPYSTAPTMTVYDLTTGAANVIALSGSFPVSYLGGLQWDGDGHLLVAVTNSELMANCALTDPTWTEVVDADGWTTSNVAVDPQQARVYRVAADAASLDEAEVIRIG